MFIINQSKTHLRKVGMSYLTHFVFSFILAFQFCVVALCAVIHGIVPGLFAIPSSNFMRDIQYILEHSCRRD
jgi:hypothetical protein